MTWHPPAPTPTASSPPPLANVSPSSEHQLPVHNAHVPPGRYSLPVPQHALPNLASGHSTVYIAQYSASVSACTNQQPTGFVHQESVGQQACLSSQEDHPSNSTSSVLSQQGVNAGATSSHVPDATVEDSPVSIAGKTSHDGDTGAAAVAKQQAPGHILETGRPVERTTKSQADTNEMSPAEQYCQVPLPVPVTRQNDGTDAQQPLASGFTANTGKPVASEPPSKAVPAAAPSGFSTGTGKAVLTSAAAMARAQKVLADDSSADEQAMGAPEPPKTAAPAAAPSGFTSGTGKAVLMSAAAQARAKCIFADDSKDAVSETPSKAAPAIVPSGFTSGSGKAVLMSTAAQARAKNIFAEDHTAAEQATDVVSEPSNAAAPTVVPFAFSTGSGKAVQFSAAAKARAEKLFADDNIAAEQATDVMSEPPSAAAPTVVPSGFSTGSGKAVLMSAAAKDRAKSIFADDGTAPEQTTEAASEPPSTAAPIPAPSGFTSGIGKSMPISAAAQAHARSMFQDENSAPLHPVTDMDSSSTPVGSSSRPGRKAAGAKPVIGTPRTGPLTGKPVMKRVKELSQSTGGKLFKKPRTSKIVSPFCPGATPARVRLD